MNGLKGTRTGVNTSEFKLAIATIAGVALTGFFKVEIPQATILEIVGLVMSYIISRGYAKKP